MWLAILFYFWPYFFVFNFIIQLWLFFKKIKKSFVILKKKNLSGLPDLINYTRVLQVNMS
jgi:hypothetical protein